MLTFCTPETICGLFTVDESKKGLVLYVSTYTIVIMFFLNCLS